ncbi:chitin deacetylase [Nowakowskiella sp. JEL0407]|nr:chitin deacetylase [Nowakowskiella sp. JEL0407]
MTPILLVFVALFAFSNAIPHHELHPRAVGDDIYSPPTIPSVYPEIDQSIFITEALLKAPIIANAMAIVNKVVPKELLNIPVSTYIQYSNVVYKGDPIKYCYWPNNLCIRKSNGNGFIADAYTCLGTKRWGLTYDDGPTENYVNGVHSADTAEIRQNLKAVGVKATFFMAGTNIASYPEQAKANVAEGHQVALHTWTHHPLTSCTNEQIVAEIKYTEAALYEATGKVSTYLRPPYGDVDDRVRAIANALGYRIALWDAESGDSDDSYTPTQVLNNIKSWFSRTYSFVSLEHDINPYTSAIAVNALKAIAAYKATHNNAFPLTISDMASCNNHKAYVYDKYNPPVPKLKDWDMCTKNSQCQNNCCSTQFSGDGKLKCTPGGTRCDEKPLPPPAPKTTTVTAPKTSPKTSPTQSPKAIVTVPKLGAWAFCTLSSQCANACCSNEFSGDKKYKCTPSGTKCLKANVVAPAVPVVSKPVLLGSWVLCTKSNQCQSNCCSRQYSADGKYKCTPGGSVCVV